MAVRRVVTRSGRRVRGYFPSRKTGRMVAWESQLERDALYLFEFSPGVLEFREQPERVQFATEDSSFVYIPDFELLLRDGTIRHVEIKPAAKLAKPDVAQRFTAIATHYDRIERSFQILTEENIRREPLLENLKRLAYHASRVPADALDDLVTRLSILPARTFRGASAVLGDDVSVYRLLASGRYRCDLTRTITSDSLIQPAKEHDDATLLF